MHHHISAHHCIYKKDGKATTVPATLCKESMTLHLSVGGGTLEVDVCGVLDSTSSMDRLKGDGPLRFSIRRDGTYSGIDHIPGSSVREKAKYVAKRKRDLKEAKANDARKRKKSLPLSDDEGVHFVNERTWKERDEEARKAAIEL